jgi:two-component system CheB/CheR fusion protein
MADRKKKKIAPKNTVGQKASVSLPETASGINDTGREKTETGTGSVVRHDDSWQVTERKNGFPVVGIGASAGGLEAFRRFFQAMPPDSGMAFVLIQHLDPTHESMMVELLAKYTSMRVVQVKNDMKVERNTVYMIPPNNYMIIKEQKLYLSEPITRRGMRMPIDYFFRSLAEDLKERAICIILSGTGADGSLGLRAVKGEGGAVLVQEPKTSGYDGMPVSAIATGIVDFILPVEGLADVLLKYVRHAYIWETGEVRSIPEPKQDDFQSILAVLHTRTNHDFRCYKKGTLTRRIQRRMGLHQVDTFGAYLKILRKDASEVKQLFRDLLIGVTAFFRDPEVWKVLEEQVLTGLVSSKGSNGTIRIWVPGCGSGEEAYSMAMLILELQARLGTACTLQIFASDIDEAALETARTGIYPENIVADVHPDRVRRFFITEGGHYRVGKQLRETVVFASQNLVIDPPFSKLDLISCRNLLIYLDAPIQKKAISLFHFALNEGGHLMLGSSESIGQSTNLFATVSKKWRIFKRIGIDQQNRVEFPIIVSDRERRSIDTRGLPREPRIGSITALAHEILLREYAPASAIVNRKGEAIYYQGPVSRFLEIVPGEPTQLIADIARDGLRVKVRSALQRSIRENEKSVAQARIRGEQAVITITVRPLESPKSAEGLLLIAFEEIEETKPSLIPVDQTSEDVHQLEYELTATREDLQSTIEELETSNEELKASNEEVMSMNEELQSTNEELETSKEELQSLNEELSTVNNQLQDKVLDLEAANNDMDNLLNSTSIATLFLDRQLQVRRFTPAATRLFRLIPTDIGRNLEDITRRFDTTDLLDQSRAVLDSLRPVERIVLTEDEECFLCRIQPYRTMDDRIDGVVVTFADITEVRKAQEIAQLLTAALHAADNCVFITGPDGTIEWINKGFTRQTGYHEAEAVGKNPRILNSGKQDEKFWTGFWKTILAGNVWRGEMVNKCKDGALYDLVMTVSPVLDDKGHISRFIAILQDITNRKHMEEALRRSEALYRAIGESIDYGVWVCEPDGRNTYASESFLKLVGMTQQQCSDYGWGDVLHPDDAENTINAWKECVHNVGNWDIEHRYKGVDGTYHHILARGVPVKDDAGNLICWAGINLDIGDLKHAQQDLQERNKELARFNDTMVGRTMRMIELKKEVNELCREYGRPLRYDLDINDNAD